MTFRILVCDGDELGRRALGRTVIARGYELAGEATTAVEAIRLREVFDAQGIVLANELQGLSGLEVVAELAEAGVRVILVSSDERVLDQARAAGAFYAVERGDLETLERALDALGPNIESGNRRTGIDRRSGEDRRLVQDWAKVIRERRTGDDRRKGDRRSGAAGARDASSGGTATMTA